MVGKLLGSLEGSQSLGLESDFISPMSVSQGCPLRINCTILVSTPSSAEILAGRLKT